MTSPFLLLSTLAVLTTGAFAPQQAGSQPLEPVLEARVQKLGKVLRCAVCQGLSITDSPSSMARAQLDKVRELVSAGKSDEEINDYFVARYGEWVLLQPTLASNVLVWLLPPLVVLGGLVLVALFVRSKSSAKAAQATAPPESSTSPAPTAEEPEDEYLKAVRAELER